MIVSFTLPVDAAIRGSFALLRVMQNEPISPRTRGKRQSTDDDFHRRHPHAHRTDRQCTIRMAMPEDRDDRCRDPAGRTTWHVESFAFTVDTRVPRSDHLSLVRTADSRSDTLYAGSSRPTSTHRRKRHLHLAVFCEIWHVEGTAGRQIAAMHSSDDIEIPLEYCTMDLARHASRQPGSAPTACTFFRIAHRPHLRRALVESDQIPELASSSALLIGAF